MKHAEFKKCSRVSRTVEEILVVGLVAFLAAAATRECWGDPAED